MLLRRLRKHGAFSNKERAIRTLVKLTLKNMQTDRSSRPAILTIIALTFMTWGLVGYGLYDRRQQPPTQQPTQQRELIKSWGFFSRPPSIPPRAHMLIDGSQLLTYQNTHRVALICFHPDETKDWLDMKNLHKSELYDIRGGDIDLVLNLSDEFRQEFNAGMYRTRYFLVLVPNGVQMEQFSTLRQASAFGIILREDRGSTP